LNALLFSSLVFSLASATACIIVKQWLKEYSTGLYGTSRDISRRRQYRLQNLEPWRVGTIVGLIPVLLLVALVLFLVGLVILVYIIHASLFAVVSALTGVLLGLLAVSTILPTLCRTCCCYSPQAR
ncbi:uncharacterized protein BXZ73DRAFT_36136, partial [Epithele typhae]|uniref:uncharacterized protein n=1 Tax=Epithele typhae TaxID=378194 RepID=UPI002008B62A